MARRVKIEVAVDASRAQSGFKQTSKAASQFSKELSKSVRGAAAGSGVFHSLGRSIAFASGGFLAFATAGEAIRKSIEAATDAAATQRQLAAQFKASGLPLKNYRTRIEEATLATSKLSGFTRDDLEQSFIAAFRGTQNVTHGLQIEAAAADVARARHISLSQATIALTKGFTGQSTALRRLGIIIPKHVSGMKLLELVQHRFAGQAKAGTTAQQRFAAAMQTTEETVGTALLPTLTKYLNRATAWLDQTKNQEKIQHEVNSIVKEGSAVLSGFGDVVRTVRGPVMALSDALGGLRKSIVLLGEVLLAKKLVGIAFGESAIGTEAGRAAGRVALLRASLLRLGAIGAIAIGIDLIVNKKDRSGALNFLLGKKGSQQRKSFGDIVNIGKAIGKAATATAKGDFATGGGARQGGFPTGGFALASGMATLHPSVTKPSGTFVGAGRGAGRAAGPLGFNARFASADLRLAQAGLTQTQADDRQALKVEAALIRERLRRIAGQRKHLKEQTQLTQQLVQIDGQLADMDQKAADKRKQALQKQIDADKQRAQALKQQSATLKSNIAAGIQNIRSQVGELFQGPVLNPSVQQQQAMLGIPGPKASTLTADLKAQTAQYARFNRDLARLGKRGAPKELLKELRGMGVEALPQIEALTHASKGQLKAYFKAFGARENLVQRVGRVQMHADIVRLNADRLALAHVREDIHVKVFLDNKDVTGKVTVEQQRRRKRTAAQRRGRHSGDTNATN